MSKNRKSVDIIMPNFNKGFYLDKSINSVLSQTHKSWKLIIIDDNSNDHSSDIIKKYKKNKKINTIFLKKNKGPGYCRNIGLKKSKSNYICFLDSDDYWKKKKLEKQLSLMTKKNYNFIYSDYYYKHNNKRYTTSITSFFNFKKFILNSAINTSTVMINKKILKGIKFKDTQFEDYIFKCDILKKGFLAFKSNYPSAHYVKSKNSRSKDKLFNLIRLFKVNKKYNKFDFYLNIKSILFISFNFLKKYNFLGV